jgi:hypothetical protein
MSITAWEKFVVSMTLSGKLWSRYCEGRGSVEKIPASLMVGSSCSVWIRRAVARERVLKAVPSTVSERSDTQVPVLAPLPS